MKKQIYFFSTLIVIFTNQISASIWLHIANNTDNIIEATTTQEKVKEIFPSAIAITRNIAGAIAGKEKKTYIVDPYATKFIELPEDIKVSDISFLSTSGSAKGFKAGIKSNNAPAYTRAFIINPQRIFLDKNGKEIKSTLEIAKYRNQLKIKEIPTEFLVFERSPEEAQRIAIRK